MNRFSVVAASACQKFGRLSGTNVPQRCFASQKNAHGWCSMDIGRSKDVHATTVLSVRKNGHTVVVADGQVTQGDMVVKGNVKKVRRIGPKKNILIGFAGSTADALTLFDRLEQIVESNGGQLRRACVDLVKAWRSEKYLRHLEATLIVADETTTFELTGNGDLLESEDGIFAIGSGGGYALAASRALLDSGLTAKEIAFKAMKIAANLCIYTNDNFVVETLEPPANGASTASDKPATPTEQLSQTNATSTPAT
eukprot:TRINITY_DN11427_c0_g1_i1.p1 TRINITY_DN11427_c0_g1~~TRINITY_DN11427_c0_g1_i1.p1  ORF type:complete len:254 (+),score=43.34 TRINITY_DN11427_c0_g1_i1:357-1118(+)